MSSLKIPALHATPHAVLRSGLRWLRRPGDTIAPLEPIAYTNVAIRPARGHESSPPFAEEHADIQVVLAPTVGGTLQPKNDLSLGGFQDIVGSLHWDEGTPVGTLDGAESAELRALVLVGRRGFDAGEGRGDLLSGWHDRARAFWEGSGDGAGGTVLSLGICEQTGVFRGERFAFLEWFARAPGPAQIISIADERTVHSSAVLLQQLRRTPAEARAIANAVHAFIGERIEQGDSAYPAFLRDPSGLRRGRWPDAQSVLFALNLMTEAMGASPLVERTDLITRRGLVEGGPPDVVVLSLGSEFTAHFRHRATGWLIALHNYRLSSFIGPAIREWLKRDFDRVVRSVADAERDLGELSLELKGRTGGALILQNLIVTSPADRIPNYSWLGDTFGECVPIACAEANLMASALPRKHDLTILDSDALAAEYGVRHCPDRAHPGRVLVDALRDETHRLLRERGLKGF